MGGKSKLDKSVSLPIFGLAPRQSQMDLSLDTLHGGKQTKAGHFSQSGEAMSRVTASAMFFSGDMTTSFRGNGYSEIDYL